VVADEESLLDGSFAEESLVDEPFVDGSLFFWASDVVDVERLSLR
jgi:hypothetical protein